MSYGQSVTKPAPRHRKPGATPRRCALRTPPISRLPRTLPGKLRSRQRRCAVTSRPPSVTLRRPRLSWLPPRGVLDETRAQVREAQERADQQARMLDAHARELAEAEEARRAVEVRAERADALVANLEADLQAKDVEIAEERSPRTKPARRRSRSRKRPGRPRSRPRRCGRPRRPGRRGGVCAAPGTAGGASRR